MYKILLVALGGALGSSLRYLIGLIPLRESLKFPIKTFVINIIGCFIIGIVTGVLMRSFSKSEFCNLFLKVGFCGGFTTFSSFALESTGLIRSGNYGITILYIVLSVIAGIGMVYLGDALAKNLLI